MVEKKQNGFTLMEVIVSLAIISILSGILFQMYIVATKTNKSAFNIDKANTIAMQKVEEFKKDIPVAFMTALTQSAVDIDYYKKDWSLNLTSGSAVSVAAGAVYTVKTTLLDRKDKTNIDKSFMPNAEIVVPKLTNSNNCFLVRITNPSDGKLKAYVDTAIYNASSNSIEKRGNIVAPSEVTLASDNKPVQIVINYQVVNPSSEEFFVIENGAINSNSSNNPVEAQIYIVNDSGGAVKVIGDLSKGIFSATTLASKQLVSRSYDISVDIYNESNTKILTYTSTIYQK